jgi:hypothetical protein
MLQLVPLSIWTAICNSTISGVFVELMTETMDAVPSKHAWSPQLKNKNCLLAMVGLGIGEIIGAILFGFMQDYMGNKSTARLCFAFTTIAIAVCLSYCFYFEYTFWFAVVMCAVWGV